MRLFAVFLFCVVNALAHGQTTLSIPAVASGMGNNYFIAGTGDGGTLSTYNSFLRLHHGFAIGSPYASNGSGGYVEKATIAFDGRSGNICTLGNIGIGISNPTDKLTVIGNISIPLTNSIGFGQSDRFTYDSKSVGNYALGWYMDSGNAAAATSYYSGYGGIKFFTQSLPRVTISQSGNVGIGTTNPNQKLTVKGTIYSTEVKVDLSVPGPDYVFEETYNLPSLTDTENYIKQNKHLPEVPSACEMEENGINLSEMNMILLKKVEELTLYLLQQQKVNDEQSKKIDVLTSKIENINK